MVCTGVPSNDIAEAGVLVRQFDRLDAGDDGKPWLPCPQSGYNSWCKAFGGLWASTLLAPGHHTSRLYMEGECLSAREQIPSDKSARSAPTT